MKTGVLILLDTLELGGAESIAVNIAIRLKSTDIYKPVFCLTREGGELENKLKEHNIKCYSLGRRHRYELHKFYGVKNIIRDENIKLIHAHKPGSNLWAGVLGRIFGLPVISHLHTHPRELGPIGGPILSKIIYSMSAKIICISEYVRQELIKELNADPSKIVTIHNGIDYRDFIMEPNTDLIEELGLDSCSLIVALIAGFRGVKNHEMLLHAAKEIIDKGIHVNFLFVGEGILRDQSESKAKDLGISENCIFTGLRTDIPEIISIIDIGVLCSLWEGIPLVVLEYMAASKPVISTDIKGVHEIIQDGENGILVPLGDINTLANAILHLSNNKSFANKLGKNGFKTVKEKFSEQAMMKKITNMYESVL